MTMSYTISGTDIEQYCTNIRIVPEQYATPRGAGIVLPGMDGEYDIPDQPTAAYDLILETTIKDTPSFYDNKQSLTTLLFASALPYLGRTMPTSTPIDVEIPIRPVGLPTTNTTSPRFLIRWPLRTVDPYWRNQTERTSVNPITTITVAGDAPVTDATFTFTGGTTPTLENTTNGDMLVLTDSPGATPVIVTLGQPRAVTRGGTAWDANFDPVTHRWMRLEPGVNAMTLTGGGTVAVDLFEKYR